MSATRKIHAAYAIAIFALLSLGATFAARNLLVEIGPTATITSDIPELRFEDVNGADGDFEIEANGDFLHFNQLDGDGDFLIHKSADDDQLVLDQNGNIAVNSRLAQPGHEVEVFGGDGASDTFAALALTPQAGGRGARISANTATFAAAIEVGDETAGYDSPLSIDLNAPSNALSIDHSGHVGIGVSEDNVAGGIDLQIAGGGQLLLTPTGNGGQWQFSPSSTTGLSLVQDGRAIIHLQNDSPENTLVSDASGNLAMGNAIPDAALHVFRSDGTAALKIEEASGTTATRQMMNLVNNGGVQISLENTATSNRWDFSNNGNGTLSFSQAGTGGSEFRITSSGRIIAGLGGAKSFDLTPAGNLTISGALTEGSSREIKENFQAVNCDEVLAKVVDMEITTWNYKHDEDEVRHMGPVAQDFRQAFALGENDTTIAAMDKDGVALASIQALNKKLEEKEATIAELRGQLDENNRRLRALEEAVSKMGQ